MTSCHNKNAQIVFNFFGHFLWEKWLRMIVQLN